MMRILLIGYLMVNAWTDWKQKEIDLLYTFVFLSISIVYKFWQNDLGNWQGIVPGLVLLLLSMIWKNHVGSGDGIVVMVFGWICGAAQTFDILLGGLLLAACGGVFWGIWNKTKTVEVPFVPFFLGSYLLELWI